MEKAIRVEDLTQEEREAYFRPFSADVSHLSLPDKFTFPFYYEPHPLTEIATRELQEVIRDIDASVYDFGLENHGSGMGKMFGVLVVRKTDGEIGYLAAFSGKIGERSHFKPFVPPVYNRLTDEGFYLEGEAILNSINAEISNLQRSNDYAKRIADVNTSKQELEAFKAESKSRLKAAKKQRDATRKKASTTLSASAYAALEEELAHESIARQLKVKHTTAALQQKLNEATERLRLLTDQIDRLKEARKKKSASLQRALHESYRFRNANQETKDVARIFQEFSGIQPPAGAGECAAPKLLNFAYICGWKPLCMAEFWYGKSPSGEVRKHLNFYPACRSKCEPILGFMLKGLRVDENPIIQTDSNALEMKILYDDESFVAVNKPSGLLSVPGKEKPDSVYERILKMYPGISGPVIVHRLDMDTSGIMVLAKNKRAHKKLQEQFIERTAKKRYVAVLEGELPTSEGSIDLPLRVDLDNRPHQMVCYEYGKPAFTRYKVIARENGKTRVHFYPHTGRTHQLRMHAAHPNGLNAPIVGDDLYGTRSNRLHLHAEQLKLRHPYTGESITLKCPPEF